MQPQPPAELDPAELAWVDDQADLFEAAWRAGDGPPVIESFLRKTVGSRRLALLIELVRVDAAYRDGDQSASLTDYLHRFPELMHLPEKDLQRLERSLAGEPAGGSTRRSPRELPGDLFKSPAPGMCSHGRGHSGDAVDAAAKASDCRACRADESIGSPGEDLQRPLPKTLGRFVLREVIGRGEFGTVYRAYDPHLERDVALKVSRMGGLTDGTTRWRFEREAHSTARLRHPGIVPLYEAGEIDGAPYLASELVTGRTLEEVLQLPGLTFREAARVTAAAAEALHHAHLQGVIHRDVKPSNIMIQSDGAVRVTDFGLARRDGGEITMTVDGQLLGTPAYMSPEQARGDAHRVDARTDVYSLGVVLYELLTGERPFRGNRDTLLNQVLHDDARAPRSINDRIPRDLETICLKATAKEPGSRYASAAALADDLRRFLDGRLVAARPIKSWERLARWCRRNPAVAALSGATALLLLTVAATASILAWVKSSSNAQLLQKQTALTAALNSTNAVRVDLLVAMGAGLADAGDDLAALPWFANALEQERAGPAAEQIHRRRIGEILARIPPLQNLWVYDHAVHCVEFSPDGSSFLTAGADGSVRIYDVESGDHVVSPISHKHGIKRAVYSPDGKLIASWDADNRVRLWSTETGHELDLPWSHSQQSASAVFSGRGDRFVTWTDAEVQVWNIQDGSIVGPRSLKHPPTNARKAILLQAAISDNGRLIVTTNKDHTARIWNCDSESELPVAVLNHDDEVWCAAISPDATLVATGGQDQLVRVWDAATGHERYAIDTHHASIVHVQFSPDGLWLATGSFDGRIGVFDARSGKSHWLFDNQGSPELIRFSADSRQLMSLCGAVRIWDLATGRLGCSPLRHNGRVSCVTLDRTGRALLTGGDDGTVRLWNLADRDLPKALTHTADLTAVKFSPDSQMIATAAWDGTARIWDVESGLALTEPLRHPDGVMRLAFTANADRLITTCHDQCVHVWETATGQETLSPIPLGVSAHGLAVDPRHPWFVVSTTGDAAEIKDLESGATLRRLEHSGTGTVDFIVCSPDGRAIATASTDGTAQVWDASTGRRLTPHPLQHGAELLYAAFSPEGTRIATASSDRTARVWDVASGSELTPHPLQHTARTRCVCFSPDGRRVASAGEDGAAVVWDANTGEPVLPQFQHGNIVNRVQFSPDGRLILTASRDRTARVWDAATGRPVTPLLVHGDEVEDACFSPDGQWIATASHDDRARLWRLHEFDGTLDELRLLCDVLVGRRSLPNGSAQELTVAQLRESWKRLRSR